MTRLVYSYKTTTLDPEVKAYYLQHISIEKIDNKKDAVENIHSIENR